MDNVPRALEKPGLEEPFGIFRHILEKCDRYDYCRYYYHCSTIIVTTSTHVSSSTFLHS